MNPRVFTMTQAASEWMGHDLGVLATPAAFAATGGAHLLRGLGRSSLAWRVLMKVHASGLSDAAAARIAPAIRRAHSRERQGRSTGLASLYAETMATAVARQHHPDPRRLIGTRFLVIKSPRPGERGVIVADYNYVFPLLAHLFDVDAVAERYHLVLQPGWIGCCTPEILLFSRWPGPVFVQTFEPRDRDFLSEFGDPFVPIFPLASNDWVDYRHAAPRQADERDIDVIMIAAWARYKRHWRVLRALGELRRRGRRLTVALVGYPDDMTRDDVFALARHYGVVDQITMYERVPPTTVSELLGRARVNLLWSRREGSNRALVEAMFADVPSVVRQGFNYGHPYRHINEATGRFASEAELPDAIIDVLDHGTRYAPRTWALANMTCQLATERLEAAIRTHATSRGESWTSGLAVKVSTLNTQDYWDPGDRARFEDDYRFLASALRTPPGPSESDP